MLIIKKVGKIDFKQYLQYIKGQCYDTLTQFFSQNTVFAPCEQSKTVSQTFSFSRKYSIQKFKNVCVLMISDYTLHRHANFANIFAKLFFPVHKEPRK